MNIVALPESDEWRPDLGGDCHRRCDSLLANDTDLDRVAAVVGIPLHPH